MIRPFFFLCVGPAGRARLEVQALYLFIRSIYMMLVERDSLGNWSTNASNGSGKSRIDSKLEND